MAVEREVLAEIGMPNSIVMRHRTPHFSHVFSGDGYSAGYYSYMWSEVLDADAFEAFEETGDAFDPKTADRLRINVYSSGGSVDPEDAYKGFRGKLPSPDAMLRKKGLAARSTGHKSITETSRRFNRPDMFSCLLRPRADRPLPR
jgi:peptidyl-dipeptidase Dcp